MHSASSIVRRLLRAALLPVLAVTIAACSDVAAPVESQQNVTLTRDIAFTAVDSLRVTALDTVDASQLSALFNSVKTKITRVACQSPLLTVVAYNGSGGAVIDTLFLYVGPLSATPVDTLTGPTFLSPAQLAGAPPQIMWVNNQVLWNTGNLLGHAPYGFALRAYGHATHAISGMTLRVEFPVTVTYLNN